MVSLGNLFLIRHTIVREPKRDPILHHPYREREREAECGNARLRAGEGSYPSSEEIEIDTTHTHPCTVSDHHGTMRTPASSMQACGPMRQNAKKLFSLRQPPSPESLN